MAAVASIRCSLSAVVARRPQVGPRAAPQAPRMTCPGSEPDALPAAPNAGPARGRRSPRARRPAAQRHRARRLRQREEGGSPAGRDAPAGGPRQTPCARPLPPPPPPLWMRSLTLSPLAIHPQGAADSMDFRIFFKQAKDGAVVSPWHDIPLYAGACRRCRRGSTAAASVPLSNCLAFCVTLIKLRVYTITIQTFTIWQVTACLISFARSPRSLPPRWRLPP